ncbi:MAG TPA: metal ABC transporter substrate-binding protein [Conexibacter sp.]|nr:metal ABC transporter substrate-binding protein [Conexibacter sp.]
MARSLALPLALAATLAAVGCGGTGNGSGGSGPKVVATTTVLGDLVRNVAGRAADVHQLLQPNSDPHDYEPRPADVVATAGAKVVFASGDGLDGWIDEVARESGGHPRVLDVGARVPVKRAGGADGDVDPHWWQDPRNAEAAVATIRDALVRANPSARATYARNAAAYLRRLRMLDAGVRTCMRAVPARERKLVTDHDAFGYFAARYRIALVGAVIPSLTTQAQPSAGDLAALVRTIRREHVSIVFSEHSVNAKLAQAIAHETGARSDDSLYGDALGPAGSDGATYVAMVRHNAEAMVRGFGGGACSF